MQRSNILSEVVNPDRGDYMPSIRVEKYFYNTTNLDYRYGIPVEDQNVVKILILTEPTPSIGMETGCIANFSIADTIM